ncbi:hypothetical protein [Novosphingobium sp. TH158]|uniref:hypothetical protein n=1 Tax=Novosphingobium sp. TH158 TaxID=2067455 RepID=UPI001181A113|nr:hypothetical protein [Novosphingobium sp. TH158]
MRTKLPLGILIATMPLALGACSVSTPVRVTQPLAASLPQVVTVDPGKNPPAAMSAFATAFSRELESRGTRVAAGQGFQLTLALSAQDSSAGLTQDAQGDAKSVAWRSAPRRGSLFDGCRPQRLRATVIGSQGLNAEPALHAEAELDTCKDRTAELNRLAIALAEAVTRR